MTTSVSAEPDNAPRPESNPQDGNRRRTIRLLVSAAVVVSIGALWLHWEDDRSYVGSTERATVTWLCANEIFWTDPTSGVRWSAEPGDNIGQTALVAGPGTELSDLPDSSPVHHALGAIHFDSRDAATFTSDAGPTQHLRREDHPRFSSGCPIDGRHK